MGSDHQWTDIPSNEACARDGRLPDLALARECYLAEQPVLPSVHPCDGGRRSEDVHGEYLPVPDDSHIVGRGVQSLKGLQ